METRPLQYGIGMLDAILEAFTRGSPRVYTIPGVDFAVSRLRSGDRSFPEGFPGLLWTGARARPVF